jgi:hypothetical protein
MPPRDFDREELDAKDETRSRLAHLLFVQGLYPRSRMPDPQQLLGRRDALLQTIGRSQRWSGL